MFFHLTAGKPGAALRNDGKVAAVKTGRDQHLLFRETDRPQPDYDGHHVQMYITDFSGPYRRLGERNLVSREDNQYQYRFCDIVDLESGKALFEIEHEIRSLHHPLYARPLVNRNPLQTNRNYVPGRDGWVPDPMAAEMDDPRVAMRQRRFDEVAQRGAAD